MTNRKVTIHILWHNRFKQKAFNQIGRGRIPCSWPWADSIPIRKKNSLLGWSAPVIVLPGGAEGPKIKAKYIGSGGVVLRSAAV